MVGTGAKTPYQYIRTVISEISSFEFYKEQNGEQYSLPNTQHDSNKILDKNGGGTKSVKLVSLSKEIWGNIF